MTNVQNRQIELASPSVEREDLADGAFLLRSTQSLEPYADNLCVFIEHWACEIPDRVFLGERDAGGEWVTVNYRTARKQIRSIAQSLIDRGLTSDDPVMILSDNSIAHGLLSLGAMYAGIPAVPVSPAYSLISQDFAKLRHIFSTIQPKIIFVKNGSMFTRALLALGLKDVEIVVAGDAPDNLQTTPFSDLTSTVVTNDVDQALRGVGPDTIAKILFTSGSTGLPKGVLNTHRMLCSNQQAIAQMWPFIEKQPPVLVDWLPWNHTFGGNHDFNLILRNGGSFYIDGGKPAPGIVEKTIANLRDIAPSLYFNVPRGYEVILPYLEADEKLRDHFFSKLDLIFYAGAALPQNLWTRLEQLSIAARGEKTFMTSAWGSTETSPLATSAHFPLDRAGVIGVPAPGTEIKMVPNGGKLEMRIRGPNVTPGYFRREDLTKDAFDEDGFYKIGDAGRLQDENNPAKGIVFDGRVAEDFKLLSGTWVNSSQIRISCVSAGAPIIQDAVVTGHDRDEVGLLVFANAAGCAKVAGRDVGTSIGELIADAKVRQTLSAKISEYNKDHPTSSTRIARIILMAAPPNIDANEITDKGYVNQRAVLEHRADQVEILYSDDERVLIIE
ncbi:MAG: feruloyl-CoA synthase [Hyphomicrobiales bacterium]|nr:feruloyl-CoA synthase [Hyphomicrobiales bacterium]